MSRLPHLRWSNLAAALFSSALLSIVLGLGLLFDRMAEDVAPGRQPLPNVWRASMMAAPDVNRAVVRWVSGQVQDEPSVRAAPAAPSLPGPSL